MEHLVVRVAGRDLGLDAARVREIAVAPPLTRVPGARSPLRGLVALHGGTLPVVDLGLRLAGIPVALDARTPVVVVEARLAGERVAVALLVDEAGRLVETGALLERPAALAPFDDVALCTSFALLEGVLVPILDLDAVLAPTTFGPAPARAFAPRRAVATPPAVASALADRAEPPRDLPRAPEPPRAAPRTPAPAPEPEPVRAIPVIPRERPQVTARAAPSLRTAPAAPPLAPSRPEVVARLAPALGAPAAIRPPTAPSDPTVPHAAPRSLAAAAAKEAPSPRPGAGLRLRALVAAGLAVAIIAAVLVFRGATPTSAHPERPSTSPPLRGGYAQDERAEVPSADQRATPAAIATPTATPAAAATGPCTTAAIVRGDTLWGVARRRLGNPLRWPEIFRANRDVLDDPDVIAPGEQLRIGCTAPISGGARPRTP